MEKVLYDRYSHEIVDKEKVNESKHKPEEYQLYTVEELKKVGLPYSYSSIRGLLKLDDGTIKELHHTFHTRTEGGVKETEKEPWQGKVCVFSDGTIFDLEEQKELFKIPEKYDWSIKVIDKHYAYGVEIDPAIYDDSDWDYHESEVALFYDGHCVSKSSHIFSPKYTPEGELKGIEVYDYDKKGYVLLDKQTLEYRVQKAIAYEEISKSIKTLQELGVKRNVLDSYIKQESDKYYKYQLAKELTNDK